MGSGRIIENVITEMSEKVRKSQVDPNHPPEDIPKIPTLNSLMKLSSRWDWVERCRQWDEQLDKVARTQQEKDVKEMVKRHAREAKDLQTAILGVKDDDRFKDLKPTQQAWVLNATTHSYHKTAMLERLSRGLTGEVQDDGEPMNPDETAEEIEDLFTYAEEGNTDGDG